MELLHLAEAEVAVEAEESAEAEAEEEEASPSDVAEETRRICGGRGLLLTKQSIDYKALWTECLVCGFSPPPLSINRANPRRIAGST